MALDTYAKAALAAKMLEGREDVKFVKGALDAFAHDAGFSDLAKGFIEGAYRSKEGIQMATKVYSEAQRKEMESVTGADLHTWYSTDVLSGLSPADAATFQAKLTAHGTETYGDITRAYRKAASIANAPEGDYTAAEVSNARVTIDKYNAFMVAQSELQDFKLESLRASTLDFARKRHLKDLASRLI